MAYKTYGDLLSNVKGILGLYEASGAEITGRFIVAARCALKRITSTDLQYYQKDIEISLPGEIAVTFTRTAGNKLTTVNPTPSIPAHTYGFLKVGDVLHSVQGIITSTLYVTPDVAVGATDGTLYCGGYFFDCTHSIPLVLGTKVYDNWQIKSIDGIKDMKHMDDGEISIMARSGGNPAYWCERQQGFRVAPYNMTDRVIRALVTRAPYFVAAYDAADEVDFPSDYWDLLVYATATFYKQFAGDPDVRSWQASVNEMIKELERDQASLTGDKFRNVPGLRSYNAR